MVKITNIIKTYGGLYERKNDQCQANVQKFNEYEYKKKTLIKIVVGMSKDLLKYQISAYIFQNII